MRNFTSTTGIAALLVIAALCTVSVGAVVQDRLGPQGGLTGDYAYKEGLNSQFHDNYKPLGAHLSSPPNSVVLEQTVTNLGGIGDNLGKQNTFNLLYSSA